MSIDVQRREFFSKTPETINHFGLELPTKVLKEHMLYLIDYIIYMDIWSIYSDTDFYKSRMQRMFKKIQSSLVVEIEMFNKVASFFDVYIISYIYSNQKRFRKPVLSMVFPLKHHFFSAALEAYRGLDVCHKAKIEWKLETVNEVLWIQWVPLTKSMPTSV